jgi:hypothetical protein
MFFGKIAVRPLGGCVNRLAEERDAARHRTHVDDVARAALPHPREHGLGAADYTPVVRLEDDLRRFHVDILDGGIPRDPRVVDQRIEMPGLREHRLDAPSHARAVGDVELHELDLAAGLLGPGQQLLGLAGVAHGGKDAVPCCGETQRRRATNPRVGAGDQDVGHEALPSASTS